MVNCDAMICDGLGGGYLRWLKNYLHGWEDSKEISTVAMANLWII